jgi:hypothetical protein
VPSARAGETYDLDADELELSRSETVGDAGTTTVFELEARGVHEARVRRPEEGLDLACATLSGLYREDLDASGAPRERFSTLHATGVQRAVVLREGDVEIVTRIAGDDLHATRSERFLAGGETAVEGKAIASGAVEFHGTAGATPFGGTAGEVSVDQAGVLFARAADGEKVRLSGNLPSNDKPYTLEATWVRATQQQLEAAEPEIVVYRMDQTGGGESDIDIHARAHRLVSTRDKLELEDDVHVDGRTRDATPWRLDAGYVRFEGRPRPDGGVTAGDIHALVARRGVRLALPGHDMVATGEVLTAKRLSGIMRFEGVPARITMTTAEHEAEWIEIDVNTGIVVGTRNGRMRQREPGDSTQEDAGSAQHGGWIEYRALSTLFEPDTIIYVLEEPRIHYEGPEIRAFFPSLPTGEMTIGATFAVFWVDRRGLAALPDRLKEKEQEPPDSAGSKGKKERPGVFDRIREFGVLNEVYLEGPVEIAIDGQPSASASAIYLDIISGNGWLADAVFTITSDLVGRRVNKITVHARWLRQSNDSSFFADEAKVSLCEFDEPHLEITTGDLRITPSASNPRNFDVRLRDNSIRMYDLFTLPLPSIDYSTDEKGRPIIATLKLGSSARFGSFVSAGIVRPAEGAGELLHDLLGRGEFNVDVDVDAQYNLNASWLGSRGVLLDLGFLAEAKGEYRWLTEIGGIPDRRDDKGYIRVPKDERDSLRLWMRTHGRYWFDSETWIDAVGTTQTDAGVQSEFFEGDFTRYERNESYLRWRRAHGNRFTSAAVVLENDHSFTGVDEVPTLQAFRGSAEILPLGPVSVTYGADASADFLRRHESVGGYESPFGYPAAFADGLGDRETLRFDTTHRVEAPFGLGGLGLRATPFALARFTAWSEDATETHSPVRAFGQIGVRIASALWKPASGGGVHQFVPYVAARRDVALQETGGAPVVFDEVEAPVEGKFVDVGFRGRVSALEGAALLDLDVRATHASSTPADGESGWNEVGTFSRLMVEPFGVPVQLTHDGRYDVETNDTLYSRVALGLRPTDALAFEAAHYRGVDADREPLFEAASIRGLYTWTEKWEFEGRQTFSLLREGGRLGSAVILRRYGHDLVFEVESSFREGEGTSFGINIRPLFAFSRPDLGDLGF